MNPYSVIIASLLILFANFERDVHVGTALNATASEEARPHFDKGLLLLHNFEYPDAAEEFILAQKADPDFALAYWGEAMTYDHPVWGELDIEKSRAALNKIAATPEDRLLKGKSELEKDLIRAVDILLGTGSKPDREKAYSEFMGTLYQRYPGNHDVAGFYALSLLAIKTGWDEWEESNAKAAEITTKILSADPDNAGALHYQVHANDHPRYAINGLNAADRYAKVASYAGHALHMPAHIYLALGRWDDVVRSNEVSWQASIDRKQRKNLNNNQLGYHSHLWLTYGYLQQGRFSRALELLRNQVKFTNELSSQRARYHLLQMKGHYLFNTGAWNGEVAQITLKTDDLDASSQYAARFLEGYQKYVNKDKAGLFGLVDEFEKALAVSRQRQLTSKDITICGSTRFTDDAPSEHDIDRATMYLNELKGLQAWMKKETASAEGFFKLALPKEGSVVVGPPDFLISPHELYGEFLMSEKRAPEAMQQFEKALAASPNRYVSLRGNLKAARLMKDKDTEARMKSQLQQNLKNGDPAATKGLW
jgi:tetratricopeptide (TPR) repeat protein